MTQRITSLRFEQQRGLCWGYEVRDMEGSLGEIASRQWYGDVHRFWGGGVRQRQDTAQMVSSSPSRVSPSCPHHPLHDDYLGPQCLANGEDVHEAETEHDEVQRQDDAPRVQRRWDEPGGRQGTSSGSARQEAEGSKTSP